jgi:hypothetical protein
VLDGVEPPTLKNRAWGTLKTKTEKLSVGYAARTLTNQRVRHPRDFYSGSQCDVLCSVSSHGLKFRE